MKTVTLSDAQIDALIIAAHSLMDGHLPPSEAEALEDAVLALRRARHAVEHSDHAA